MGEGKGERFEFIISFSLLNNRLEEEEEEEEEIREKYTVNRGGDSGLVFARALSFSPLLLPRARHPPSCSPTSLEYVDGVDSVYARLRVRTARVLCLANERAFCPSSPFSNPPPFLPSPEFALPVSSALALSRERETERVFHPSLSLLQRVLGSVQPPPTHSLTHPLSRAT